MKRSRASTSRSSPAAAESREPPRAGPTSLYVHVPFCIRRCAYCDFATAPYDAPSADAYLNRLALELQRVPRGAPLRTIYFGGGTPTALSEPQLAFLLERVRERVADARAGAAGSPLEEWTCEANPESLTPAKARMLREAGVDRVSLGAQSFDPLVLAALGREHAPEHVFRALALLRDAGFERLSLDLMFAAPGESDAQLARDLATLAKLISGAGIGLEHVSAYCLTYEPGTPLTRLRAEGRVTPESDDVELQQYRLVRERLADAGLAHYEISNFARPGRESRHNLVYWQAEEYYGVGLGAGSYEHGVRRSNTRALDEYLGEWGRSSCSDTAPRDARATRAGAPSAARDPTLFPPHEAEELSPDAKAREAMILGLRLRRGVDLNEFRERHSLTLDALYTDGEIESLLARALLEQVGDHLRLTDRGLELADEVFVELV